MGMAVSLLCMAKGRPVPELQWYKDGVDEPLEESSSSILYQINSASKKDSGTYTCCATNQAGRDCRSIQSS